eukprot:CAMPEP_0119191166 /NCGR_PEP_ID=MMETSP1316-20130426/2053_1 /TAXON_ID=41880 /ORGANISM="Pycnococcus provasolii, Strain RCC2336" /LENGTH=65 /DNA_ID=CAMNT_0007186155 /DNA_START=20 /DNA_END=213 /DNA_ORIENTATION=-
MPAPASASDAVTRRAFALFSKTNAPCSTLSSACAYVRARFALASSSSSSSLSIAIVASSPSLDLR